MVLGRKIISQMFSFSKILVNIGKNGTKLHKIIQLVPIVLTVIQNFHLLYHHVPSVIVYRTNWIPPPGITNKINGMEELDYHERLKN